jgi:PPP family 3-phenylpropionic acid transporter
MVRLNNSQYTFAIFFFFYYAYLGVLGPYFTLYVDQLGFTAIQISFIMAMPQMTRILGPIFWGWLADFRQDRIGIMRITGMISLAIFVGIFFYKAFLGIALWMFLINTFSSSLTPLGEAATLHYLQRTSSFESQYGKLRLWGSIGFMLAVFACGFWFEAQGIQTLPWVGLVTLVLVTIAIWCLWEPALEKREIFRGQLRAILYQPEVMWFFSSTFWMVFAHATLYTFYSLYLQKLGFGKQVIGLFWMIAVAAEVLYFYFQKFFYGKFDPFRILRFTFILGMVRFLVIAWFPSFWPLLFVQLFHAGTFAAHHSASIHLLQKWFKGATLARGQALYSVSSYGLGGTVGGLVAGWVWDAQGPRMAFAIAAVACTLGYWSIVQSQRILQKNHHIPE